MTKTEEEKQDIKKEKMNYKYNPSCYNNYNEEVEQEWIKY